MRYLVRFSACLCLAGCIVLVAGAQTRLATDVSERWASRLERLSPDQPIEYFLLGEEIADEALHEAERGLARYVFGMAGALDPTGLGRSTALALADLATEERERDSYKALAALLNNRAELTTIASAVDYDVDVQSTMAVVEAFSYFRAGNGAKAQVRMRVPGAIELLDATGNAYSGGAGAFLDDCQLHLNVRPRLSEPELIRMLLLEHALLAGEHRSWGSELVLTNGRPLLEVDPDRLDVMFNVDVTRPMFRDGQWVESPAGNATP